MYPVVLHNDATTLMSAVAYALTEVCGLSPEEAVQRMLAVHRENGAEVIRYATAREAEQAVARLHFHGIEATVVAPR